MEGSALMPEGLLLWNNDPDCQWVRDYFEFEFGNVTFRVLFFKGDTGYRYEWYLFTADQNLPWNKPYYRGDSIASHWSDFIWACKAQARDAAKRLFRVGSVTSGKMPLT